MDRRDFFKYSAGAVVGASLLGRAADLFARDLGSYSVVILGDTHYDAADPEKYHAGYALANKTREENHRKEFVRNGEMWEKRCPALVKRAAGLVGEDTRAHDMADVASLSRDPYGHDPFDLVVTSQERGDAGNLVTQMLIDPQGTDANMQGACLICIVGFSEDGKKAWVRYYSADKQKYYMKTNQYEIDLE